MAKQGVTLPKARSTGTTIVGVIFNVSVKCAAITTFSFHTSYK